MTVYIRILCAGAHQADDRFVEVEDGATVLDVLVEYVQKYDNRITAEFFLGCVFHANNSLVKIDDKLKDGDRLTVMRPKAGG